ncbi:RNA-binding S4 domain-containing protein [Thalassiella azotivora]
MDEAAGEAAGEAIDEVAIRDESIRLGQLLKLAGLAEDGAQARLLVEEGDVRVDGEVETRRGRQVPVGSVVTVYERSVRVVRP